MDGDQILRVLSGLVSGSAGSVVAAPGRAGDEGFADQLLTVLAGVGRRLTMAEHLRSRTPEQVAEDEAGIEASNDVALSDSRW